MALHIEIYAGDDYPAHLAALIPEWRAQCFPGKQQRFIWAPTEWIQWAFEGQMPVSILQMLARTVRVGKTEVRVGGIAGVMTPPAYQRHGYASANMRHAADFLREELGVPFGLLGCEEHNVPFYARLGWQPSTAEFIFDQPDASGLRYPWRDVPMILPFTDAPWPDGDIDMCGLPW